MNRQDRDNDVVLDREFTDAVADSFDAGAASEQRVSRLHSRIMEQLDDSDEQPSLFETIRSNEGKWIEILPNVEKKILNRDANTGIESYLLRMQPGSTLPVHDHDTDELCYVIEGELSFGDLHLKAGDYHFARKGSRHKPVTTATGTLLFLQSGIEVRPTS